MIKKGDFRSVQQEFQEKFKHDVTEINTNEVMLPADKTHNLWKMEKDYNKFLSKYITKIYKKSNRNKVSKLNLYGKKIADKLLRNDRVGSLQKNKTHITVKDHKKYRFINLTKTNIGEISRTILAKINKTLAA